MAADAELLLSLYRQAMTLPQPDFRTGAITLLHQALRFQSSIWGTGHLVGREAGPAQLVPLEVHTDAIDPAGFERWKGINGADKAIPVVLASPRKTHQFHAPTLFNGKEDAAMRDYAKAFGRQSYLITTSGPKGSTLHEWCSLYRPDPQDHFSEAERARCQLMTHHLWQAAQMNRLLHGAPAWGLEPDDDGLRSALAAPTGDLISAQPAFLQACVAQWRQFDGRRLPASLLAQVLGCSSGIVKLPQVSISFRRLGHLLHLQAKAVERSLRLSPRRLEIAMLFAQGYSSKEIAKILDVAPQTVRSHIHATYRLLEVSGRSALRAALSDVNTR